MSITINPYLTTVAAGSFNTSAAGLTQGTFYDDPAARYSLAGGYVGSTETLPMWGGIGISEATAASGKTELGGSITRATSLTPAAADQLTGFTVFNQAHAMISSPQSPVPLAGKGASVNIARLGSGLRVAVACDPSLIDLDGNVITQNVSWDFNTQRLQPYVASGATEAVSTMTWANTNGGRITVVMSVASVFNLGDTVYVSGATNSGTGGNSAVNGAFVIDTWTDNEHFTLAAPAAAGVIATIGGTILLNVGTGALPCKILEVQAGNSMTVQYDPTTGFATWNRSGTCAVILI
jgi:hypothetical protein